MLPDRVCEGRRPCRARRQARLQVAGMVTGAPTPRTAGWCRAHLHPEESGWRNNSPHTVAAVIANVRQHGETFVALQRQRGRWVLADGCWDGLHAGAQPARVIGKQHSAGASPQQTVHALAVMAPVAIRHDRKPAWCGPTPPRPGLVCARPTAT